MSKPENRTDVNDLHKGKFVQAVVRDDASTLEDACEMLADYGKPGSAWEDAAVKALVDKSGFGPRVVRKQLAEARKMKQENERVASGKLYFKTEEEAVKALKPQVGILLTKKDVRFIVDIPGGSFASMGEQSARAVFAPYEMEGTNAEGEFKLYPAFDTYLKSPDRRVHYGMTCDPRAPSRGRLYNTWTGFALKPNPSKGCPLILDLVENVLCGGEPDDYASTMEWLAQMVQHPAEKPGCMLVFQGGKGVGKSTLADLMRRIIGPKHSMKISQKRHLTGNFNEHVSDCLFLQIEELGWAGDEEMEGVLKDLVTSDRLTVEAKNGAVEERFNMTHLMLCSNRGFVVPYSGDERRFLVNSVRDPWAHLTTRDERNKKAKAYFDALYEEINNGGAEAFLHHLMQHKLGSVDLRRPHVTAGMRRQAVQGLNAAGRWLVEALETGGFSVGEGARAVTEVYYKNKTGDGWHEASAAEWPLEEAVAVSQADLKRSYLSAVRHHGSLTADALVQALGAYLEASESRIHVGGERVRAIILPSRQTVATSLRERHSVDLTLTDADEARKREPRAKLREKPSTSATPAAGGGNVLDLDERRAKRVGNLRF